jgi:hypothetical protein
MVLNLRFMIASLPFVGEPVSSRAPHLTATSMDEAASQPSKTSHSRT